MPGAPKTILVTGANRGIGLAICQLLLSRSQEPLHLLATSRAGKDLALEAGTQHKINYPKLDISSQESIHSLVNTLEGKGLDVLINNAGINLDAQYNLDNVRKTLDVNYRGTLEMCRAFLPLLKNAERKTGRTGRIVNLSSIASQLKAYSPAVQQRFRDSRKDLTLPQLSSFANEYLNSVENKTEEESGFGPPRRSYSISKAFVNAFTAILARENPEVLINACCPGWVATEMGFLVGRAPKSIEDGAKIPVRLAVGEVGGVTGEWWANESIRGKGEGEVREW